MYESYSSDTDDSEGSEGYEDARFDIIAPAGHNLNTQVPIYLDNSPGAEYDEKTDITSFENVTYLNPPKTSITSLYCVESEIRDKVIYPSPYNFQLKLPRVYKNVTKFQLVQLTFPNNIQEIKNKVSLVSSFSSFLGLEGYPSTCVSSCLNIFTNSSTKANSFGILEQGRVTSYRSQMLTKIEIPEGKFSNSQIAEKLTLESNNTPPFNMISYNDFKNVFKITKDITLLFNEPGDNYKSKLLSNTYKKHTKEIIMNTYYSQHDIDKHPIITDTIALNAYYYPVLKELLITEFGAYFINTELSKDQLKYYVLNTFLGLDSTIYYEICSNNIGVLDEFRKNFTFEHRNINNYNWTYDNNRFVCNHDTLHTSLKSDIANSLDKYISDELYHNSLNKDTFNTLKINNANNNTILADLQSNLSTVFGSYFLESGYEYNGDYITDSAVRTFSELNSDPLFTNMFNYSRIFGNQYGTFSGINLTFTNFLDYNSTISSYYNNVQSTSNSISTIYGNIYDKHHQYISYKYDTVLPSDMIENKSYTSYKSLPVAFVSNTLNVPGMSYVLSDHDACVSTCYNLVNQKLTHYYSCLPVNTIINTLQYKLGIATTDINFKSITTYFDIVSNNHFDLFLQINPELSFNNMDVAMPENYSVTTETTGQAKLMYAKILTGGIGASEITQTCIQNPIVFTNTLGKLDKISFKIYLDDANLTPMWLFFPFAEQFNEWSATFQIDEEIGYNDRTKGWSSTPTIPIPADPDQSNSGLAYRSKN